MPQLPSALRDDVRTLGTILGEILRAHAGAGVYERVEQVRALAKRARAGDEGATELLTKTLADLPFDEVLPVARAFSLFLTLVNIAESHHRLRKGSATAVNPHSDCRHTFKHLLEAGVSPEQLHRTVSTLGVELVLTAHPTQVVRRTLLRQYNAVAALLSERDVARPSGDAARLAETEEELRRVVTSIWDTDEVKRKRPTPLDEVRGGLAVLEQVVWSALPEWTRKVDQALVEHTGRGLPLDAAPVRFGSWMGGDRDGNPNVSPSTTLHASWLGRWMAAGLFHDQIDALRGELSGRSCNDELRQRVGDSKEPYRAILREARERLANTKARMQALLEGRTPAEAPFYSNATELREVLLLCYRSLCDVGQELVARGGLLDTLRRLECFALTMVRLDLRQESTRHSEAIDEICQHLGFGSYLSWDEPTRQAFLVKELESRRPLIPWDFAPSPAVADVIETFRIAKRIGADALGAYVISMARAPSDVLAVELLQQAVGNMTPQRVVPLFETLADLQSAGETMRQLFQIPWYHRLINGQQEIMIGYSDSAKDGGRLAANWELYNAQEEVVRTCRDAGVHPTLFHGRGGTVARGGGPTHLAIQSQPPGSISGTLRVTEQGEMIQAKFGNPGIAAATLETYTAATIMATLQPPREPKPEWRHRIAQLAERSCQSYRRIVHEEPQFVEYFRMATPEVELGALNIGSRPARRRAGGGVETLRAIPWIFAWTQTRLCLPSWLGVDAALDDAVVQGHFDELREMYEEWPFFRSTLDLLEMVVAKADPMPSAVYDRRLVAENLRPFGEGLRGQLRTATERILQVTHHRHLLQDNDEGRTGLWLRNPYIDPINMLQVELLRRLRAAPDLSQADAGLWEAFVVTVNGIAAGMRNTG
jgi:phosphoenolpyruvate carboxylase